MTVRLLFESILSKFRATRRDTVFFRSFRGQYNDNPKYISEKLHEVAPGLRIVWCISGKCRSRPPDYVETVPFPSSAYDRLLKTAAVVIDNYIGVAQLGFHGKWGGFRQWLARNNRQLCISTWHGTPLKKIGADLLGWKPTGYATSSDFCVAGCQYTADCLGRAFLLGNRIRLYGTPRNDLFFKNPEPEALKRKLGLPSKRLVLFAPTFRDDVEWSGVEQVRQMDIPKLLATLGQKFGGEFAFVFRVHSKVLNQIKAGNLLHMDNATVADGNQSDDMAEYLACADVLITDYSGSLFDFALTPKPCFLFAPDREHYEHVERGFYMRYEDLPYPIAESFPRLLENIESFDQDELQSRRLRFLSRIGNVEDGHASERIVQDIVDFLESDRDMSCERKRSS